MKLRISILMFLSFLVFYSCEQEEFTLEEDNQIDKIDKRNDELPVVFVYWGDSQSDPVSGAMVFNMETNELVAKTDDEGNAYIEPIPGKYRVVDPNYGTQQAIVKFPQDFAFDEETGKKKKIIAWDINGNPIYE